MTACRRNGLCVVLGVIAGFVTAVCFLMLGYRIWWVEFLEWRMRVNWVGMGLCLVGLLLVCVAGARRHGIGLLSASLSFLVSLSLLGHLLAGDYASRVRGRLGQDVSKVQGVTLWLADIANDLSETDPRSSLTVSDLRVEEKSEEPFSLSWSKGDEVYKVLMTMDKMTACSLEVTVTGSPLGKGPFPGNQYTVTLTDTPPNPSEAEEEKGKGNAEGEK